MTEKNLTGTVSRLVHISPTGGAIFRLLEKNASKSIRIVAPGKAMPFIPEVGESLTLTGQYVNDRKYGHQFSARSVIHGIPEGRQLVKLLTSHPRFAWMEVRLVRALWKSLGPQLQEAMVACDVAVLANGTRMSLPDAIRLVREWRAYVHYSEVSTYFATRGFPLAIVAKAMELWGNNTITKVSENPYILVPLAGFEAIDEACFTYLGNNTEDKARLIAACISCTEEHIKRNRTVRVPISILKKSLCRRLGNKSLAAAAFSLAESRGLVLVTGCWENAMVQPLGIRILENAFVRRVALLADAGAVSSGRNVDPNHINDYQRLWKHPGVCVLNVSCFRAPNLPKEVFEQSLHIFPSASVLASFPTIFQKTALLSDVLGGKCKGVNHTFSYIVYGSDALELTVATKLIYALPELCHLTMIPIGEVADARNSFWHFIKTLKNVSQLAVFSGRAELYKAAKENAILTAADGLPAPRVSPRLIVQNIKVESAGEAQETALALYREAIDSDTALLLTLLKGKAAQLNYVLHDEHIELRKAMRLPIPSLSIYGKKSATIGEKIVAREDIPNKNISAGSLGVIIDIVLADGEQRNLLLDTTVATARFDTTGRVELSAADCARIDFGYALPLELDRWSAVAHRVCIVEQSSKNVEEQIGSQILRTTKSFRIVEMLVTSSASHSLSSES